MQSSSKEIMNHLLEIPATNEVIAKMERDMQNLKMPSNITPEQYAEPPGTKALRDIQVYEEYTFMGIIVEGLADSVLHSMCFSVVPINCHCSMIQRYI